MNKFLKLTLNLILLLSFGFTAGPGQAQATPTDFYCRYGIGVPKGLVGYDLSTLGIGSYLDWGPNNRSNQVPDVIRYFHVLKVSDRLYASTLSWLPFMLNQRPGAVWIIGNEPDSEVTYQDHITPQVYAQRYFEMASMIRSMDPTATIGFGTVIQLTPVRRYYLAQALDALDVLTGNRDKTLTLIDVFTVHNFILNEEQIYKNGVTVSWGAGLPPGYVAGVWPEPEVITIGGPNDETWKTHNLDIFANRIKEFRTWMVDQKMRDKQLWITEYGSLFPSVGQTLLTVSDSDAADFLQQTMDYMLTAQDQNTGLAADENRLVQHFVWYSLNEDRWRFGGSLFDPDTRALTPVGERFMNFDPSPAAEAAGLERKQPDLYILPGSLMVYPVGFGSSPGMVNYRVVLRASNYIQSEYRTKARVELKVNGVVVDTLELYLPRCSGQAVFNFILENQLPGEELNLSAQVVYLSGGVGSDKDSSNDSVDFPPRILPDYSQTLLPQVSR